MARLLIIDDQISMAQKVAEDIKNINPSLAKKGNVYCIDNSYSIVLIDTIKTLNGFNGESSKIAAIIIKNILAFAHEHQDEEILIMLDYALKGEQPGFSSIENILRAHIYAKVIMCINSFLQAKQPKNISLIIYSANDFIFAKLCKALTNIYNNLDDKEKTLFPKECTEVQNISWVNGGDENINSMFGYETRNLKPIYKKLHLPPSYRDYISKMQ